jgi:hypothetical protein
MRITVLNVWALRVGGVIIGNYQVMYENNVMSLCTSYCERERVSAAAVKRQYDTNANIKYKHIFYIF